MKGNMADYFTKFSLILPLKDDAQKQYALKLHKQAVEMRDGERIRRSFPKSLKDCIEDWCFDIEDCEEGVWLNSDYGGIDAVCAFVQHLLQKYDTAPFISFEWSHDCTKPRVDAFGGGAAVITKDKIETMNTSDWIRSKTT